MLSLRDYHLDLGMKNHWLGFLAALISFTRLPVKNQTLTAEDFNRAINYLPLVGLVVGSLCAGAFYALQGIVPTDVAILAAVISGILLTGAIHEDGFADCCDGFAASRDKDSILRIMKDPANGSFASLGLIALFSSKLVLLAQLPQEMIITALMAMHVMARALPLFIAHTLDHCNQQHSKMSANLAIDPGIQGVQMLLIWGFVAYFLPLTLLALLFLGLLLLGILARRFFRARLQGYNGDCLGAVEQLAEILILFLFVAYLV